MKNNLIQKRFEELFTASDDVQLSKPDSFGHQFVDYPSYMKWVTNVQNLIIQVFGVDSPHYSNLLKLTNSFRRGSKEFDTIKSIFIAAKEDYEGGYLFDLEKSISGEILGDFLALSKMSLRDDHKDVAAVLASAALEDALKRYASKNGLDVEDKVMQEVVSALKSKGLVSGAQKGLLETMPKIRDYSMHANWDKIKPEDVSSIIGFVEQFLITYF